MNSVAGCWISISIKPAFDTLNGVKGCLPGHRPYSKRLRHYIFTQIEFWQRQ